LGHEINVAKTGASALASVEEKQPQLVIMDVQLPDISGFNVCQQIREKGHTFPILLSSASNSFGSWVDQLAQGFLFKPYTQAVLRSKVEALLESPPEPTAPEDNGLSWNWSGTFIHHLRNGIGCIGGLIDMFKVKRNDKAFQEQFIDLAQQAVATSIGLLEEFGQLNQPLELKPAPMQLDLWLKDLVQKNPLVRSSQIAVHWQMDVGSLAPLTADPAFLARALNAVLDNALEAMPKGGTLTITAHGDAKKRWNFVMIQDTGNGMDEYVLEHAFVPFFTMKKDKKGMGLSWAQKIVMAHGGNLEISSAVNNGTSVLFRIPTKIPARKTDRQEAP